MSFRLQPEATVLSSPSHSARVVASLTNLPTRSGLGLHPRLHLPSESNPCARVRTFLRLIQNLDSIIDNQLYVRVRIFFRLIRTMNQPSLAAR